MRNRGTVGASGAVGDRGTGGQSGMSAVREDGRVTVKTGIARCAPPPGNGRIKPEPMRLEEGGGPVKPPSEYHLSAVRRTFCPHIRVYACPPVQVFVYTLVQRTFPGPGVVIIYTDIGTQTIFIFLLLGCTGICRFASSGRRFTSIRYM